LNRLSFVLPAQRLFTPLARKTSKGALQNQDLFFKDFFCNICSKHVRLRDFLGGISKNNLIRDLRTYEVPLVLNFLQQNISKRTKKGKFFSILFMLFFVWFFSRLC